jgi:hypothetical protein
MTTTKTIYAKLVDARKAFHKLPMQKSGYNAFHKFKYFELSDFLIPGMDCLAAEGLLPVLSFTDEYATMTIYDTADNQGVSAIVITSPMRSIEVKGSNAMQALGSCETYNARYLWVHGVLMIVENDLIDSLEQKEEPKAPTKPAAKLATKEQRDYLQGLSDSQIPPRRLVWLGENFERMTEAQARSIIKECEDMKGEK